MQLGFVYGAESQETLDVSDFRPLLLVGGRMPHAWVRREGTVIPLLDLLDSRRFTLLVGKQVSDVDNGGPAYHALVKVLAEGRDFEDPDGSLRRFANLAGGAAILVRPDGHVAAIIPPPRSDILTGLLPALLAEALFKEVVA